MKSTAQPFGWTVHQPSLSPARAVEASERHLGCMRRTVADIELGLRRDRERTQCEDGQGGSHRWIKHVAQGFPAVNASF